MLPLQRAIFLRGVFDPCDSSRITTTLYRPKHMDLRYEEGFVRAGDLLVPLDNVVELKSLPVDFAPVAELAKDAPENVDVVVVQEAAAQEEPLLRRRGRPRKNTDGESS